MADTPEGIRPVPRWLHVWAVLAVAATFVLLLIGQLVTSFRAGMADWVWPTEPWYVFRTATESEKLRFREDFPFFIEHTHRIMGWTVGGVVIVLSLGLWWEERCRPSRFLGLAGVFVLVAGYGEFHRELMAQRDVSAANVRAPLGSLAVVLFGFALACAVAVSGVLHRSRGAWLRFLGTLALAAVMIQGLLGGFRVKLNELVGTDLAAVHGVFAQVVFGLLVGIAVLTARSPAESFPSRNARHGAGTLAILLFVQVIWGAMIRHDPTPLTQRLHFLTAFIATGFAVWLLITLFSDQAARVRVQAGAILLGGLLCIQLYLGVEAWMEKFGAYTLPELVPVTVHNAKIRTLHALVGSAMLATSVGMAIRLMQRAGANTDAAGCSPCATDSAVRERDTAQTPVGASLPAASGNTLEPTHAARTPGDAT